MTAQTSKASTKAKKIDVKSIAADVQDKAKTAAKTAYAKGSAVAGELGTITKGNAEAMVASGKVLGSGLKALGETSVSDGKAAMNTLVADIKALGAVKSPTQLLDLQFQLAQRNLNAAFLFGSRNAKALGKIAGDAAAPLSSQAKANLARLRQAA